MTTPMTEEEFWAALTPGPEPEPIVYRLYYNEQGEPLFYSPDDLPGNYIEIDQNTFANSPTNVRVIDGKLVVIKTVTVHKLVPGDIGTACHPQDVSIVVNDTKPNTKWMLK
jgi:hypothetical protein